MMRYTKLTDLNIELPCLGFGCWQLGGHGWGKVSESEIIKAIYKAIDEGLNLFDTAPIYGLGHSEEVLGKVLGDKRRDIIIATKVGQKWKTGETFERYTDNSPSNLLKEIDASLKRLKTDYIDIYQIHWPDPVTPIEDTMSAMEKLKRAGKIRSIGCCNFDLNSLKEALIYGQVATAQMPYNLIDREIEDELLPFCHENNIAVIAYNPIAKGLLSGNFDSNVRFDADDNRNRHKYFQANELLKNLEMVERVKGVAKRINRKPVQVALRWLLKNAYVTTALFGVTNATQLEENLGILDFELTSNELELLNEK